MGKPQFFDGYGNTLHCDFYFFSLWGTSCIYLSEYTIHSREQSELCSRVLPEFSLCSLMSYSGAVIVVGVLGGTLCAGAPLKWFSPLLHTCWHGITSHNFPGWFVLPAPSHVSLFVGRLCSPKSSGAVSLPTVARPRGPQKPCPSPVLSGGGEQEGIGSVCWTCAGALQVLGWERLGSGARLAGAALTPSFLCPQRRDRADRYLHCPGLPPEDGEG